jgi:hypothetical protein
MEREEIPVTSTKHIQIFRETITPPSKDHVRPILDALLDVARKDKVTGKIEINLIQGGVRTLNTEQIEESVAK